MTDKIVAGILTMALLGVVAGFLFLFWVVSVGTGQQYAGYFGFAFMSGMTLLFVAAGLS